MLPPPMRVVLMISKVSFSSVPDERQVFFVVRGERDAGEVHGVCRMASRLR
jgi:hypothetical protein